MLRAAINFIILWQLGIYATTGLAKTMSVRGHLPRDTSLDYFDLEVKVTDITKTTPALGEDLFKDRIRIWLTDLSSSESEYVPFENDPILASVPFTVRLTQDIIQTPNASGTVDFSYNVRISANSIGGLKDTLLAGGSKTAAVLRIYYYEEKKPQAEVKTESVSIAINTAIVKSAPADVKATGTHRAIKLKWSGASEATWSDGSSSAPSKAVAVAIDRTANVSNLPAYLYDSTAPTDADAADDACVYVPDNDVCAQCADTAKHYLNPTKLGELTSSGVFVATTSASAGEIVIDGLENGKTYSVFTFFTPGGLERSNCQTATAAANTTWSEHSGEGEAKLSDPKCFVATAAYGSPLHHHLKALRWFRDEILLKSKAGEHFVNWYYEHGPKAAQVIIAHPFLKPLVQSLLWLPVMAITAWMTIHSHFSQLILIAGVAACFVFAGAYFIGRYKYGERH
jgi:hypothetical protein